MEELDKIVCLDAHACDEMRKQFYKAHGLTYKLTNYKLDYSDGCYYYWLLLLDTDVVKAQFHHTHMCMVLSFPRFLHSSICGLLVQHCLVFIHTKSMAPTLL